MIPLPQFRDGAAFQIQVSGDGEWWEPMQPRDDYATRMPGQHGLTRGGDHWFASYDEAWVVANHLRSCFIRASVRLLVRDADGAIIGEQPID